MSGVSAVRVGLLELVAWSKPEISSMKRTGNMRSIWIRTYAKMLSYEFRTRKK